MISQITTKSALEAASVLLIRPWKLSTSISSIQVLLVKRPIRSASFANHTVFPGGKVHAADVDKSWIRLVPALNECQDARSERPVPRTWNTECHPSGSVWQLYENCLKRPECY